MVLSAPVRRMVAGAFLLLLALLLFPSASSQVPEPPGHPESQVLHIVVLCPQTLLQVDYASSAEVECVLEDASRDSVYMPGSGSGTSVSQHSVQMSVVGLDENDTAWQVILSRPFVALYGGDRVPFTVNVKATPLITTQSIEFGLHVVYTAANGYTSNFTLPFVAEVNQYDFAVVRVVNQVQKAGQNDVVVYTVEVQNVGVYPDSYRFSVDTDADIYVSTPPSLFVPPGETRTTNVTLLTPKGKLVEMGRSVAVNIKVSSATGTGTYGTIGILQMRGPYVPTSWMPLLLVGLVSAGIVTRRVRERAELSRLEQGRPRRVQPTPRQAVLLAALKKRDPEAYKLKKAELDAVYRERLADYRAHRKERAAADREEARKAHLEYVAAKKRRKAEEKARKAEEKRARKLQAIEDKKERKLTRKKEKELAKKRKALEKRKAKLDKKQAKLDKKQAKADAKAAKLAAKEQAKAERAARKAAKAAKKKGGAP